MSKHFYSHLIEIESTVIELEKLDLTEDEKRHLATLIDTTLHHTILDAVMSELSEEDKKQFLEYLFANDNQKIWKHLNDKVENIEQKIKQTAVDVHKELKVDIKEAEKIKNK